MSLPTVPKTYHPFRPSQLSLDPPGLQWDCPLGSKDAEEEEGPWGGGSGLPPPGCFSGSWRHDVGLDCKGSLEGAEARAWTVYHYSLLQSCLQQAGLPETQDRSQVPRAGTRGLHGGRHPGEGGERHPQPRPVFHPRQGQPLPPGSGWIRSQGSEASQLWAGECCFKGHLAPVKSEIQTPLPSPKTQPRDL